MKTSGMKIFGFLSFFSIVITQQTLQNDNAAERFKWELIKKKIEQRVERGEIDREKANQHYQFYKDREMLSSNRKKNTVQKNNFKKVGIDDLEVLKNDLKAIGISDSDIEAVLGGLLRLIHAAKTDKQNFIINPRIKTYFIERLGLTNDQLNNLMNLAMRIALIEKNTLP